LHRSNTEKSAMPLSEPADRELLHLRDISLRGYRRADGLFDVEAEILDTKNYDFSVSGRAIGAGEPLHNMILRITVDTSLIIVDAEAVTHAGPFAICGGGAATFSRLKGLAIRAGFMREANARLGGIEGCTHIRELLQQMATVAYQTSFVLPSRQSDDAVVADRMVNSCHAYSSAGPIVRQRWPDRYTGAEGDAAAAG